MHLPWARLWQHPAFRTFWLGQTVSLLGSAVTLLALPAVAIYRLCPESSVKLIAA
jgi:hypothetical protein